jgi:hypothetical protein
VFRPSAATAAIVTDQSLDFGGTDEHVIISRVAALDPTAALSSFEWVKGAAQTSARTSGHWQTTSNMRKWQIGTGGAGSTDKLLVNLSGNGTAEFKLYITTGVVFDSTWKHVGFTFASNVLTVYVNAVAVAVTKAVDSTINSLPTSAADLEIGSQNEGGTGFFIGKVTGKTIWDKELTASEVTELYNGGVVPDATQHSASANLIWWGITTGDTANTITDRALNSNGTMVNMEPGDLNSDVPA